MLVWGTLGWSKISPITALKEGTRDFIIFELPFELLPERINAKCTLPNKILTAETGHIQDIAQSLRLVAESQF
jgi:hypothetical protein